MDLLHKRFETDPAVRFTEGDRIVARYRTGAGRYGEVHGTVIAHNAHTVCYRDDNGTASHLNMFCMEIALEDAS